FAFPIAHFPRRGWPRSVTDRLAPLLYLSPTVTIYRLLPHEVVEAENTAGWFEHGGGFAWRMRIAPTYARYDDRVSSAPVRLFLYEDGVPLGPRMALHEEIRRKGGGRYSHWGDTLIFSTSDNSDPNENGRRYTFRILSLPYTTLSPTSQADR
ncbi:MAG: hypothetical protein D6795_11380, partial [Deltaproteobacteria bacterium]